MVYICTVYVICKWNYKKNYCLGYIYSFIKYFDCVFHVCDLFKSAEFIIILIKYLNILYINLYLYNNEDAVHMFP